MPVAAIQYPGDIVNYNNNGGWHRQGKRAYRNAVRKITDCLPLYREARLYHLCFEGKTHPEHMKMLHALRQMTVRAGMQCEWFAAREVADGTKADHLHVFMLIDAHGNNVWKVFNQFDDGQVGQLCGDKGIKFAIFSPKDFQGIHGRNNYMALPYQGPGNRETALGRKRLADALVWLTYLYKARSKPQDDKKWQIFPASRPTRKAAVTNPSPSVDLSTGKANHIITEKETQHEINTPAAPSQADSTNQASSPDSSSSQSGMGQAGPRLRVPAYSASTSPQTEAKARPGQAHGGADCQEHDTRSPITHSPGGTMLTAAEKFVAAKYEAGVDAQLDLDAMRRFLLTHGIKRSPAAVVFDLDERYGFYGYAASHPAPPFQTYAEIDAGLRRSNQNTIGLNLRESARCKSSVSTSLSSVAGLSR